VSVHIEDLALIELPAKGGAGSRVVVQQRLGGGQVVEREGWVVNLVEELDPETRRAQLLVLIERPLDLGGGLPLLPGAYVDAEIHGRALDQVYRIPRAAISDGATVWIVTAESTLVPRTIEPHWGDTEAVYVSAGLHDGDLLVVTPLSRPVVGARVRPLRVAPEQAATMGEATNDG
jgi:hypothetical protein